MRIATRTKLCGSGMAGKSKTNIPALVAELRELCSDTGDNASLAIGITALRSNRGPRRTPARCVEVRRRSHGAAGVRRRPDIEHRRGVGVGIHQTSRPANAADVLRWAEHIIDREIGGPAERSTTSARRWSHWR